MIVIVFVTLVFLMSLVLVQSEGLFSHRKEGLLGEYYERAIAAAVSCREAAMARLSRDFFFRTSGLVNLTDILSQIVRFPNSIDCQLQVKNITDPNDSIRINQILANSSSSSNSTILKTINPTDVFVEITTTGKVPLPSIFPTGSIWMNLRTVVGISYSYPVIIFTDIN